jgi:hypothetical protein
VVVVVHHDVLELRRDGRVDSGDQVGATVPHPAVRRRLLVAETVEVRPDLVHVRVVGELQHHHRALTRLGVRLPLRVGGREPVLVVQRDRRLLDARGRGQVRVVPARHEALDRAVARQGVGTEPFAHLLPVRERHAEAG